MKSYEHLSYQESCIIYQKLCEGNSNRSIAKSISRSPSTISRELKRHSDNIGYHPKIAQKANDLPKERKRKIDSCPGLRDYILKKLDNGWSPGTIAGRWKRENQRQKISAESIYTWIYLPENAQLELYKKLPRAKRKRGLRRLRAAKPVHDRVSIHLRPDIINNRSEVGHCEADLMFHSKSQSANILTMVDRKTRYARLIKNNSKHSDIIMKSLKRRIDGSIKSITFDNGTEFAQHKCLKKRRIQTFFCDPGCPWQKGSVEHLNGMLRRRLPFKMHASLITQDLLDEVEYWINNMPRKSLGFFTPSEFMSQSLQTESQGCCTSNLT